ncbi:MAG: hypothetical protein M3P41_10960 [Actinomycetota bacterium]|nr:hypothetical protein [Actinomycetota bacterium]
MIFRRARFAEVIGRQLDVFTREHEDVIKEAAERLRVYNAADRDEAEELYGDYVDAVETGTEILADLRDNFAQSLEESNAERYLAEFNRAVAKRLPEFALEIENR